ncbi:otoferlin, partial [Nephila pilipes]
WFEWPVGSPVQSHEVLEIVLLNYNKYFSNKIVGTYGLVLQKLIEDGHLRVSDSLVDVNNMPTEIVLLFDVSYNAPDGSVGEWSTTAMQGESFEDDRQALIVIEHNIANLERSINNRQQQQQQAAQDAEYHVAPRNSGSALSLVSPRSPERKRCVTNTRHAIFTI